MHTKTTEKDLELTPELEQEKEVLEQEIRRLETYWWNRGYVARFQLVLLPFHRSMRSRFWALRSNIVNGLPTDKRTDAEGAEKSLNAVAA